MTVEEYFRFEEESAIKHEYVAGEVYAMSGATARHNLVAGTVFARFLAAESGTACRVFMSDMRLEAADDKYYYPDVVVVVVHPLMEFGVLEARDVAAANKWEYLIEVRRTPLFDRLLRFEFDRGRGELRAATSGARTIPGAPRRRVWQNCHIRPRIAS